MSKKTAVKRKYVRRNFPSVVVDGEQGNGNGHDIENLVPIGDRIHKQETKVTNMDLPPMGIAGLSGVIDKRLIECNELADKIYLSAGKLFEFDVPLEQLRIVNTGDRKSVAERLFYVEHFTKKLHEKLSLAAAHMEKYI